MCLDLKIRTLISVICESISQRNTRCVCVCSCLQVRYECLSDEIKIGDYYLRLLLEEDENEESNAIKRS